MSLWTTMFWMGWLGLCRDKVALALTFALPVVFFSLFAVIFGGMFGSEGGGMGRIAVALIDDDRSPTSERFVAALRDEAGLRIVEHAGEPPIAINREIAQDMVRNDRVDVAIVIPKRFGEEFPAWSGDGPVVQVLADKQRNPVAPQVVVGLMQKAAMTGTPDLMIERGLEQFERYAGGMTAAQREALDRWLPMLRQQATSTSPDADHGDPANSGPAFGGLVRTELVGVQREQQSDHSAFISFQVAQTAVMFLLFSMAGAAGTLLEEQENGTLDRLLSSNVGMLGLMVGKWLFIAALGVAQLAVMFLWAWWPFGLTLFTPHHLAGWGIMSVSTAAAGSAFGMLLATACRSRAQLGAVSTIVILLMSALGGSMFPRFMMSDALQRAGLATFNGWALDGYRKVFYDQLPLWELWPQVTVLAGMTFAFMLIARRLARRWEMQ